MNTMNTKKIERRESLEESHGIPEMYAVYHKGKINMYISPNLVATQGLKIFEIVKIKCIHGLRLQLFDYMETLNPTTDKATLKVCAEIVEAIEFGLQKAWHFSDNRNYHSWWCQVPHCKCPRLDNQDRIGTDQRIINETCPVHV